MNNFSHKCQIFAHMSNLVWFRSRALKFSQTSHYHVWTAFFHEELIPEFDNFFCWSYFEHCSHQLAHVHIFAYIRDPGDETQLVEISSWMPAYFSYRADISKYICSTSQEFLRPRGARARSSTPHEGKIGGMDGSPGEGFWRRRQMFTLQEP